MKLNKNFVLRQIAETWVVVPLQQETVNFNGMLTLNNSGAMLWQVLEQGADQNALVAYLTNEYDVSSNKARADVDEFLNVLRRAGCIND